MFTNFYNKGKITIDVFQYTFRWLIQHTFKCDKYRPLFCNNTPSDVLSSIPCRTHPYK